ncbi:hypothetical protein MAR_002996 [Mya arenaria]|uniref:Uncharacterized protein n=1 Tax=Mya arenaria TaxID=6604 RepID=A0ABY7G4Q8_MYAAR|nr:hypothetical protein MAR_002996 [Mya arenaria]
MAESIETRHENWLRVVWGLLYVRKGLQGYADTKGKQQYQTFISSVRDIRNKTLHDAHYELDGQTADDCLDKMITVLQDPQELIHDTFAQQAAHAIRNIKAKIEKTPAIMTETLQKWLQTNFDVDKHLKEIEGLIA